MKTSLENRLEYITHKIYETLPAILTITEKYDTFDKVTPKYLGFYSTLDDKKYYIEDLKRDTDKLYELSSSGFNFEEHLGDVTVTIGFNRIYKVYESRGLGEVVAFKPFEDIPDPYINELKKELQSLDTVIDIKDSLDDLVDHLDFRHMCNIELKLDLNKIMEMYNKVSNILRKLNK